MGYFKTEEKTDLERLFSKREIKECPNPSLNGPCWVWLAGVDGSGYGSIRINTIKCSTHRVSYELLKGPIPTGLELDHLCRVIRCFNPDHLEPVTHHTNILRGECGKYLSDKTHCVHGHEFTEENTKKRFINGKFRQRVCAECNRIKNRKRRNKPQI